MNYSKSVKPISYLKAHAAEMIRDIGETHEAVIITQNGEAKAVLQSVQDYQQLQESLALLKMIHQSRKSIAEGRSAPAREVFRKLRKNAKARRSE